MSTGVNQQGCVDGARGRNDVGELGAPGADFLPVHGDVVGGVDAESHLPASDPDHGDESVAPDHNHLPDLPRQD